MMMMMLMMVAVRQTEWDEDVISWGHCVAMSSQHKASHEVVRPAQYHNYIHNVNDNDAL